MNTENEVEEFLAHYGVKGMKWGRRRDRNRPGGADGKKESAGERLEKSKFGKLAKANADRYDRGRARRARGPKFGRAQQSRLDTYTRVANGKTKVKDALYIYATTSNYDLIKNKGYKGVAKNRVAKLEAMRDRMNKGEATVLDRLDRFTTTPVLDLIRDK